MFLILPRSMIIPEIPQHLEDTDFEDWLTAAIIEKASQQPLRDLPANGTHLSPSGIADLWMVEIKDRTGKVWRGKFQVEFAEEHGEHLRDVDLMEHRSEELLFFLDTESAEISFNTDVRGGNYHNRRFPSESLIVPKTNVVSPAIQSLVYKDAAQPVVITKGPLNDMFCPEGS
jgi:hypothetical protein